MNLTPKTDRKQQMNIQPYQRLVSLPVHSENVFHFPKGLPAFEQIHEYVFLLNPELEPFVIMQALQPADITFVCIDPFLIYPEYRPVLGEADRLFLRLDRPEDAFLLSIVVIRKDETESTVNLQAPLVINIQTSMGKQILCEGQDYPIRYRLSEAIARHTAAQQQQRPARRKTASIAWAGR